MYMYARKGHGEMKCDESMVILYLMFKLLTVLSVHVFMICVLPLACMVARRYVWPRCL